MLMALEGIEKKEAEAAAAASGAPTGGAASGASGGVGGAGVVDPSGAVRATSVGHAAQSASEGAKAANFQFSQELVQHSILHCMRYYFITSY